MKVHGTALAPSRVMKITKLLLAFSLSIPFAANATEGGNHGGGGGGVYEAEFKRVATNIAEWIKIGNSKQLKLPADVRLVDYNKKMLKLISSYSIEMTSEKVYVDKLEKTCRSWISVGGRNHIRCNFTLFDQAYRSNMDQIYRIVHHEFAGLASLEKNVGAKSDYRISDKITAHLKDVQVRMLPIEPEEPSPITKETLLECGMGQLKLQQQGHFEMSEDLDPVSAEAFFKWLRANPNSPLSKAEKQIEANCGNVSGGNPDGTSYCGEMMESAPDNGVTISWSATTFNSTQREMYFESWRDRGTGVYTRVALQVEVSYDGTVNSDGAATSGISTATLLKISAPDDDGKLKVLYAAPEADPVCRPVKKHK